MPLTAPQCRASDSSTHRATHTPVDRAPDEQHLSPFDIRWGWRSFFLTFRVCYRFDVNLPHGLAVRPLTRLRCGGGAGACGPCPCGDFGVYGMFKSNWYKRQNGQRLAASYAGCRMGLSRPDSSTTALSTVTRPGSSTQKTQGAGNDGTLERSNASPLIPTCYEYGTKAGSGHPERSAVP